MPYLSRQDWRARNGDMSGSGEPWITFPDADYHGIEVHHSVTSATQEAGAAARGIQDYHLDNKGWTDIFYSFLIHQDGTVVEGRGWNREQGKQSKISGKPQLIVCLIGNYENNYWTKRQHASYHWLRAMLLARNYKATPQLYHQMRANTACPGSNVIDKWTDWITAPTAPPLPIIRPPLPPPPPKDDMFTEKDRENLDELLRLAKHTTVGFAAHHQTMTTKFGDVFAWFRQFAKRFNVDRPD